MGKQIYHKPIWALFRDFANELSENEVFVKRTPVNWFRQKYPRIKESSVVAHLIRLTTNSPTRFHYKATIKDDQFFQIDSKNFRKYNPQKDPMPIYVADSPSKTPKSKLGVRRPVIESRVNDLIENFHDYVDHFTRNIKFSGPSTYFHKKVIDKIRDAEEYELLFDDESFFEYIYATLASWGMHRMGEGGAKMNDFSVFKKSVYLAKNIILDLKKTHLELISEEGLQEIKQKLASVFDTIHVMASGSKLVGNSKAMHHLLPDLVPPIDRQHTLRFFYGNTNIIHSEEEMFLELFEKFREIATHLRDEDFKFEGFNTSLPKIIDNAIMGYVMMKLLKKSNRHEG